jgi:hypothetical protein
MWRKTEMKKYYTIDYDLNRPTNKIVSAPLNSNFGVGVRMWRNGSALDSDITVGGIASSGTRGGYKLFDLSTGNKETITDYEVSGESKFNLRVYETNKNYIEKWSGSEPPQWDVISGRTTFTADTTTTEEVSSELFYPDPVWIYAKQVKSFTCTYSDNGGPKQTVASFMNVQVEDDEGSGYYFCHAGDPTNGNIWYESEGGMSSEKPSIKVAGAFRTIHFPVEAGHTYEIEWKLEYDADMQF